MKRRHSNIFLIGLFCLAIAWFFRFELLFYFQCSRLRSMRCAATKSNSCIDKIWVHRVNTAERFKIVTKKFSGVETDIVFDAVASCFWVYHPPLTDKKRLLLDEFMKNNQSNITTSYWLDTRGVDSNNVQAASVALKRLDSTYHLKNKIILELYDIVAANYLSAAGYSISMNIPINAFTNATLLKNLQKRLSGSIYYVSQESSYVKDLQQAFPEKRILTWAISFSNYIDRSELERIISNPRVERILVNVKSRYHN